MNGPIKSDTEKGALFDWMESGIVFAGLLVVFGLLMESWPEIKLAISEGRFPKLTVTGGIIVTVGVLIEVVLGIFITQRANRAQSQANERVANALERAGIAEQQAAEANLARVKIEQRLAPRKISAEILRKLVELLKPHAGKRVDVCVFDSHVLEVYQLARNLQGAFSSAGWNAKLWLTSGLDQIGAGVVFATAIESDTLVPMRELLIPPW
jgi:hypothetical protein